MTITALVPALVALVGALFFAVSTNPKIAEMGKIALLCGLLVFMFVMSTTHVQVGTGR